MLMEDCVDLLSFLDRSNIGYAFRLKYREISSLY